MSSTTYIQVVIATLKDFQVRGYWLALRPARDKLEVWVRLAPPHREYSTYDRAPIYGQDLVPYLEIASLPPLEISNPWIDDKTLEEHLAEYVTVPSKQVICEEHLPLDALSDPDGNYRLSWIPSKSLPIRYVYGKRTALDEHFQEGHVEINFYGVAGVGNIPLEAPLPSTPRAMHTQAVTIMSEHWNKYGELLKRYLAESKVDSGMNDLFAEHLKRLQTPDVQ